MLCIVSALGMRAQTWTASDLAAGRYVFQNIGSGRYLGPSNSWGTQASLLQFSHYNTLAKIQAGVYTIESQVSNGGTNYYFTGSFMDGAAVNVTIQDNGEGIYTMSNGTTYYGYDGSSTVLASNLTDPTDANAQWKIIPFDYDYADATEENPADLTYRILDSNFDRNNRNGGGSNNDLGNKWTMVASNQNLCGGDNTNCCAESWRAAFTLSQTITVPNGYYKLQAQAALTEYTVTGADFPVVYATSGANTVSVPFKTMQNGEASMTAMSTQFTNGNYFTGYTDVITVTNGSLTVGVKGTRTDTWCIWDNFNLVYMGPIDLSTYQTELANAVAAAQAYRSQLPAAVYASIEAVVTENNKTYTTEAEYTTAITAINNAVSTYATATIIADYSRYKNVKAAALAVAPETDTEAADAAVEDATTTEAIDAAVATLRAAFLAELPNVTVPETGLDVTAVMLDNASVRQNTNYWTAVENGSDRTSGSWAVVNYEETEFYNNNFKFYQTLSLTSGTWEFGVTGFHRAGNHSTYFYAGDDKILIPGVASTVVNSMAGAKTYFDEGNGKVSLKFLMEEAKSIEIGIDNKDTETDKWTIFRDFTLKYYGAPDYSVYDQQLAATVAEAAAVENTVPTAAYTALNDVVTENNKTYTKKADYLTAIANIETAIATAKALQAPYATYKTIKTQVEAMKNVEGYTETTSDATSTLTSTIAGINETVEGATTAAEVTAQNNALKAAAKTFLAGVRSDGEHPFDITFFITNPNFDNNNIEGWSETHQAADQWSGLNTRIQVNEFYQSTFDFNQTLTSMPNGNYELKVQAFQRPGFANTAYPGYLAGTSKATSVIYINDGTTTINHFGAGVVDNTFGYELDGITLKDKVTGNTMSGYDVAILDNNGTTMYGPQMMETAAVWFAQGLYDNTVLTAVDGDLKIGFKSTADAVAGDWTIFDNFRLYYYGQSINVTMDEAVAFSALADIEGANVTMTRNTKAGLNTIALPFDLTEAQVKEIFGDDAVVYAYSDEGEADATTVNFNTAETKITANVPVLVKATKASTEIKVDNVTVKTGEAKAAGTNFDFVGNYAGQVTIAAGDWFVSGGKLYESTGATTIKGFRAYLKDKNPAGSGEVKLYIDGVATAISEINADVQESGVIYNLAGQRVSKATRGIYVKNGKKVVVK